MRILQVSTSDRGGGAEAVALALHRALRAAGEEAWLGVGFRRTAEEAVLQIGPGRSRRCRALTDPGVLLDAARGREDFRFPESHRLLELAPSPPDVLHVHNLHGGYFDLRALPGLSTRVPTVVTMHDEWLYTGHCAQTIDGDRWLTGCGNCPRLDVYPALAVDGTAANWRRKRALHERARLHVVAPCAWLAERVGRSILAPALSSLRVIPNGVDLGVFAPGSPDEARSALGLPAAARVVVFAAPGARSNPYKDFSTLRAALGRLGAGAGPEIVAFSLGEEAPDERLGRVLLRSRPFVSPAEVAEHLRSADLFVLASKAETHPLTVLEALACGTPVVASRVGGIPEQLTEATGLLVEPGRPEALAAAVDELLGDRERLARMRIGAAEDARRRFSLQRQVDAYVELYDELAGTGTRSGPGSTGN